MCVYMCVYIYARHCDLRVFVCVCVCVCVRALVLAQCLAENTRWRNCGLSSIFLIASWTDVILLFYQYAVPVEIREIISLFS